MTKHQLSRTMFIACTLIAFAGSAQADVVLCIADTGSVTFTDGPCDPGSNAFSAGPIDRSATKIRAAALSADLVAAEQARAAAQANKQPVKRGLALDVATMEHARSSVIAKDRATALARRQALAQPKSTLRGGNVFAQVSFL
jgi:hypothetical protein